MTLGRAGVACAPVLACAILMFGARVDAQSGPQTAAAIVRRADSLFKAGANDAALSAYESALKADSMNSRAVFQVAVLRSWKGELNAALALHWQYVLLEPRDLEGRVAYARVLAWAGRFAASVANYDTVLSREADYRDAALGRATALGWWGKFDRADSAYRAWIAAHPNDTVAVLGRAQELSWAGHLDEALAIYRTASGSAEARRGEARVLTWKGDVAGGVALWEAIVRAHPNDAEAWVGLAQAQRWLGRDRAARDAVDSALRVRPGYEDALQQRRWIDAELSPMGGATAQWTHDSDDNTSVMFALTGGVSVPAGRRLTLVAQSRRASLHDADATATGLRAAWGLQSPSGKYGASFDAAATQLDAKATAALPSHAVTLPTAGAHATAQLGVTTFTGGFASSLFDEVTSSIRTSVALQNADADVSVRLPSRVSVGAAFGSGRVVRGADGNNGRWSGAGSVRWSATRSIAFSVSTRAFGYERTATDGYFSPRRYQLTQASAHWDRGRDLGWQLSVDGGIGRQRLQIRDGDEVAVRSAWNASASTGYRGRPGFEWTASGIVANVASPGAGLSTAEYRYSALTFGARVLF